MQNELRLVLHEVKNFERYSQLNEAYYFDAFIWCERWSFQKFIRPL